MTPQERKELLQAEFAARKANNKEVPKSMNEIREEAGFLPFLTMHEGEQIVLAEETQEDRIFQLECQVSMLHELVVQLIGELKQAGVPVSDKLQYPEEEDPFV